MSVLVMRDLTIRVAGRTLLDGADLAIGAGQRVGLLGRNGAGKSTLLGTIAGVARGGWRHGAARARSADGDGAAGGAGGTGEPARMRAGGGRGAARPAGGRRGRRAGGTRRRPGRRGRGASGRDPRAAAHDRGRQRAGAGGRHPGGAGLRCGGAERARWARSRAGGGCGWRWPPRCSPTRTCCCSTSPPTISTSEATIWLEAYLQRFPGAVLVVSHDRNLLDNCGGGDRASRPGENQDHAGRLFGVRADPHRAGAAAVARGDADRGRGARTCRIFVDRFRAKASKARQAQARIKALAKMPMRSSLSWSRRRRSSSFPTPALLAPPMLTFENASVGYDGVPVLRNVSLRLDEDDRMALLGPNGRGKSTLAKMMAGRLAPLSVVRSSARTGLRVGYFAQHQSDELDGRRHAAAAHGTCDAESANVTQARSQLAQVRTGCGSGEHGRARNCRAASGRACCWHSPRAMRRSC